MYQKNGDYREEKLDVAIVAADIADWSITRYGYFINSSIDKLEMIEAFSEELGRLPSNCLNYVQKAKDEWIDLSHKRPPTMPDFLQMLRAFNNHDVNKNKTPRIEQKESPPSLTAGRWDNADTDERKKMFFKSYKSSETSQATKWVIREWLREKGVDEAKITSMLG
ncbi:MAG: hypothetical protein HOI47_29670 [Candidatus Scalindua sp.]|nr:hypothetical protein [Candidatus Scalindua sp.]